MARVPEPVDTLRVRPHRADVTSQFGLREHHPDTHTTGVYHGAHAVPSAFGAVSALAATTFTKMVVW